MLEDEYLFFQPLLDQFNKLYSYIKEDSHAKSAEIDKLMVRHGCRLKAAGSMLVAKLHAGS